MGLNVLSEKNVKRLARQLCLPIERAVVTSHADCFHVIEFRCEGHIHGQYNRKTGELRYPVETGVHWTSCREQYGG